MLAPPGQVAPPDSPLVIQSPSPAPAPMGHLTLIGAGHVFQIGPTIRGAIQALRPDVVFLELDAGRLNGLLQKARGMAPPASGGFVHRRLAQFQEGVAGMYGADVGSEMLAAVQGARDVGARVALIDDPADQTVRRALREITWRERFRAVGMMAGAGIKSLWPPNRRRARDDIERELARYQADPQAMMAELSAKFPTLHRVLIAERDERMAKRIRGQLPGVRHGVAVLGDGHVGGMLEILRDLEPTVYRLAAVREGRLPRPAPVATGTPASVGFTVEWRPGRG